VAVTKEGRPGLEVAGTLPSGLVGTEPTPSGIEPRTVSEAAISDAPPRSDAPLSRGATLGRYVILDVLGRGAMGVVYAAFDPELDRKVAIKLVRPEASDHVEASEGRARLQREARAIARVAHPNVIAVHDVGTFADEVFVAMEYVDGTTLTQWLEAPGSAAPRPWRDVVATFAQAGRGLAAAHAAGLVHRDFKPDNVLVGKDGRARVLDFGLARAAEGQAVAYALTEALSEAATESGADSLAAKLTQSGVFMGTPAYMAPEQLRGATSDARLDQFSFCIALYEGLYGERPFAGSTLPALAASLSRGAVRDAPKSSHVPQWLREVVLRGLRVKPEERYPSMDALLADLTCDPTRARMRVLGIAAAAALVLVSFFAIRSARNASSQVCRGADKKLAGVWDAGRRLAVEAAFVATGKPYALNAARGVAHGLDTYARGWVAMETDACEATRVRGDQSEDLLDLRMACLSQRREEMKSLVEVFAHADGGVVEKALRAVAALGTLDGCANATALKQPVRPPSDPAALAKVAELRTTLADVKAMSGAGKYTEALPIAERAKTDANALHYAPIEAEALYRLGVVRGQLGDSKLAEQTLREALYAAEASRHDEFAARAWVDLLWEVGYVQARYDEALDIEKHARAAIERWGGNEALLSGVESHVGVMLTQQGKHAEAREHQERAFALRQRAYGAESPEVAIALNNLGIAVMRQRKNDEAATYFERALAMQERLLGPTHPDLTLPLSNLSGVRCDQGRLEEALGYDERSLGILEQSFGSDHPRVGLQLTNLCSTKEQLHRYEAAVADCERAVAIYEKTLGPTHPRVAFPLTGMGHALFGAKRFDRAAEVLERAVVVRDATACDPSDKAETYFALAQALDAAGRDRRRARTLALQAEKLYEGMGELNRPELDEVLAWLRAHR
jgi:tetratricopeptide (TPR) repeat protein/tRNA A-37 threonylcarbamoyl transferase component Bud32